MLDKRVRRERAALECAKIATISRAKRSGCMRVFGGGRRILTLQVWPYHNCCTCYELVVELCTDCLHLRPRERLPPEWKQRPEQQLLLLHAT